MSAKSNRELDRLEQVVGSLAAHRVSLQKAISELSSEALPSGDEMTAQFEAIEKHMEETDERLYKLAAAMDELAATETAPQRTAPGRETSWRVFTQTGSTPRAVPVDATSLEKLIIDLARETSRGFEEMASRLELIQKRLEESDKHMNRRFRETYLFIGRLIRSQSARA